MIGKKLKEAREKKRIPVYELAEKAKITPMAIYNYESGAQNITAIKLVAICKVLKVSSKAILGI